MNAIYSIPLFFLLLLPSPGQDLPPEATDPPPLPSPRFEDPEVGEKFKEGVGLLEERSYKEARSLFRRLKSKMRTEAEEQALKRCILEADGGIECDKIAAEVQKGRYRRALSRCDKITRRYHGTLAGVAIEEMRRESFDAIYLPIADFEKKASAREEQGEGGGDGEGDGGGGGDGGAGRREGGRGLGRSGYGPNSTVIEGTPEQGKVRSGKRALRWRTGALLSAITFRGVEGKVSQFRYLNLSMRSEDPKKRPQLVILFDCREGGIGQGRGRGRRGGGRIHQREGFHYSLVPDARWKDLRLDLKRQFKQRGDVDWNDVLSLRVIHMPGVEGRILLDDIRLEKE